MATLTLTTDNCVFYRSSVPVHTTAQDPIKQPALIIQSALFDNISYNDATTVVYISSDLADLIESAFTNIEMIPTLVAQSSQYTNVISGDTYYINNTYVPNPANINSEVLITNDFTISTNLANGLYTYSNGGVYNTQSVESSTSPTYSATNRGVLVVYNGVGQSYNPEYGGVSATSINFASFLIIFIDSTSTLKGVSPQLTTYQSAKNTITAANYSLLTQSVDLKILTNISIWRTSPDDYMRQYISSILDEIPKDEPGNPYGADAGTGGGDGDGTPTDNDTQADDGIPSLSITSTGLISLYTPSLSQLQAFGNFLWSDLFSLDTFKKLFSDPMDAVLGMSIVPLNLSGTDGNLIIGNIDTGLTAPRLNQQYYNIDCGSFTVQPDINSYLDYSPYTRFQLFLPYIGFKTLDADDIMGQTINVRYKVDVLTTALICEVRCDNHLRYSFSGTCGTSIPITAQSWTGMIQSVISSATAVAGVAVGAAAAPVTGGASLGMSAVGAAGSIAGNSLSMKPDIQKSGSQGGSPGFMGWQTPFLIRYTPRRVNSASQQSYTGYPSLITSKLSDVHGYTEIQSVNLSVSGATDAELGQIDRQLKEGVILP